MLIESVQAIIAEIKRWRLFIEKSIFSVFSCIFQPALICVKNRIVSIWFVVFKLDFGHLILFFWQSAPGMYVGVGGLQLIVMRYLQGSPTNRGPWESQEIKT